MGTPGTGRYTNYVPLDPASAERYNKRLSLFNNKASADKGDFQKDLVDNAVKRLESGAGDLQMFPTPVNMAYGESKLSDGSPDFATVEAKKQGGPANAYVPDLSSPGAVEGSINVDPKTRTGGALGTADIKPNYVVPTEFGSQDSNLGTLSPSKSAVFIGASPIKRNLTPGSSK